MGVFTDLLEEDQKQQRQSVFGDLLDGIDQPQPVRTEPERPLEVEPTQLRTDLEPPEEPEIFPPGLYATPERTKLQQVGDFFVGKPEDRQYLPPDATPIEKIDYTLKTVASLPLRAFVKFGKGLLLNTPDIAWAAIKKLVPDAIAPEVEKMNLDEAMDWAMGYNPSGFSRLISGIAEFAGSIKTVGKLLPKAPKDISLLRKAGDTGLKFAIAAAGRETSKGIAGAIDEEADFGYRGGQAIIEDYLLGAAFSVAGAGLSKAVEKVAQTPFGKSVMQASNKAMIELSKAFPKTMDAIRRDPSAYFVKQVMRHMKQRGIKAREMSPDQKAVVKHMAREAERRFAQAYKVYIKSPAPDIVTKGPTKRGLQITDGGPTQPIDPAMADAIIKADPEFATKLAAIENPSRTDVEALGIKLNAQERTELSGALKTALEQPTEKPIVPVSEPTKPVEPLKEVEPTDIAPKAVEAKPEAVELTDQGPLGVWEEGVLLEDTPKELAKVITEVRKNEGDAAAKIVKRLQDAGIDTTSTHFNEETGEITIRAMNISDENKAILEKRGVTITQFPPMSGDYLIFKPTPTAKPEAKLAKGKKPKGKVEYTTVPAEWKKHKVLRKWGSKGLRTPNNDVIKGRKTFNYSDQFTELPTRLPKKTMKALKDLAGDEIFRVETGRSSKEENYWLVPKQVVEQVKAELGKEAFIREDKKPRSPKQLLNGDILSLIIAEKRGTIEAPDVGRNILDFAKEHGVPENEIAESYQHYIKEYRDYARQIESEEGGAIDTEGQEREVRDDIAIAERIAIQDESELEEEIGDFFDGLYDEAPRKVEVKKDLLGDAIHPSEVVVPAKTPEQKELFPKAKGVAVAEDFTADPTIGIKGKGEAGFVGIEGRPGGKVQKPWLTTDKTESPDSDIEDFFGRTKKLPGNLNLQAAMERVKFILRGAFTTQTPHLETTPKTAYIRDIIRTMPEQQRAVRESAVMDILAILENDGSVKSLDRAGLDLLRRKVFVQDLLSEAEIDRSVSGDLSLEQLQAENNRLDVLINQVPSVKKAFEARQKLWKDVSNDLFKRGVLDEEARDNVSYVRHFVIDYINNNRRPVAAKRKKLAEPYRAYKKQRKGSRKDISTDYLAVEVRALADIYADNVIEDIANDIAIKVDRRHEFKKIAKDKNLSLQEVAEREGYVEWHYKRPNLFYRAQTLDRAKIAALLEENAVDAGDMIQIPKSMMHMGLVMGKRAGWYIPEELAMQLDDLPVNYRGHPIIEGMAAFSKGSIQFWKRWILRVNPLRYNARNQLGDTERVIASGQEAALKRIPQALKILITKEGEYYESAKEYGVIGSSLWHEMGNVSKLKEFEKFKDFTEKKTFKSYTTSILLSPLRLASRIGTIEQDLTQLREDILRLSVYIENLERMRAGKKIRHWAGQIADIEAIAKESKERAAAKMSRETLIDYGSFTIFEDKVLRNGILPFYSFFKRNLTFWPRAFVKATQEGTAGKTVASALPRVTFNMAMWLMRIMAGYAAAWLWNHKDEESREKEEAMPFWLRSQPHLNIGEKTLWGNTALSDFGEWGDVGGLQSVSWRHEAGFIDQKQAAMEAAIVIGEAPVNKLAQAINPFIKATGMAIYGQSVYPDVFEPRYVKGNKYKRAILDVLGTDAMKFYETTTGDRRLEDTLYAYFAGWWVRPNDPETIIKQIMSTEAWSSLKRKSPTTGRGKGKAKSGREAQWQETKIRRHLKIPKRSK